MAVTDDTLEKFGGVRITSEMKTTAEGEIARREPHIMHHFRTAHYTQEETDTIGFYGEFALRVLLGLDWKAEIRPDYKTINSHDILTNGWAVDVKTESIPKRFVWGVISRTIRDNEWFGRRLYHVGQRSLLAKYDILVMGAVVRKDDFEDIDAWFPIGWLPAGEVVRYPSGNEGPRHHSGRQISYPSPAYQITTADLRAIEALQELLRTPRSTS